MDAPLLAIRDLHLTMSSFDGEAHVLNGIELTLRRGEIWGLVGESGCGKSLTGLSISRLLPSPPARYLRGEIRFEGRDMLKLPISAVVALCCSTAAAIMPWVSLMRPMTSVMAEIEATA